MREPFYKHWDVESLPCFVRRIKVLLVLANPIQALTLDVNGIKINLHL